jgi:hypothetical protein
VGDDLVIALLDAATGKYQRAGSKIDLIVAYHHEDFDFAATLGGAGAVAQQQDGRRRPPQHY